MRNIFLASPIFQSQGIAIVRIITGILLVYHGWETFDEVKMTMYSGWFTERHYSNPEAWAYAGKIAELVAGIGFIFGMFTSIASLISIAAFTGIIFILGDKGKIFEGDQHPFLFILLSLVFFFTGPGTWSIDRIFLKKNHEK